MVNCNVSPRFFMMAVLLESVIAASRKYSVDLTFDDKKSDREFLPEYNAQSLPFCSALCGSSCGCFGFNSKHKKCRVYNPCNQTDITVAEEGWRNYFPEALPRDCHDFHLKGQIVFGVNQIYPFDNTTSINVQCKMENNDAWTVIQQRRSGSVSFNRTWVEYKNGFENVEDSYWIGNDVIHQLTKGRNSSLYVSITLTNGTKLYELYNQFSVADENNNYTLYLGGPATGTLGDRMLDTGSSLEYLSGMSFTTLDRDHDRHGGNCAVLYGGGGWWYNACHDANLNGKWSDWYEPWYPPLKNGRDISETLMMIKPN